MIVVFDAQCLLCNGWVRFLLRHDQGRVLRFASIQGRHGQAFTRFGKVNLRNAKHATDPRPIDPESSCPASSKYSRAYIHHLMRSGELLGMMLLSWANIAYYQELMQGIRGAITENRFEDFRMQTKEQWKRGEA